MASSTAGSSPKPAPNSSALYLAVETLKDSASAAFLEFENEGDLTRLSADLGSLRDRAESIQAATIGIIDALNEHL